MAGGNAHRAMVQGRLRLTRAECRQKGLLTMAAHATPLPAHAGTITSVSMHIRAIRELSDAGVRQAQANQANMPLFNPCSLSGNVSFGAH